ncbi:hypothetical protein Tco_0498816 [Tanacetum coccineum]
MMSEDSSVVGTDNLPPMLAALHDEIAKMKPSGCDTKVSRPKTPEKPKVLAPGMYAISSKYTPHQNELIGFHRPLGRSMLRMKPAARVSKTLSKSDNQKSRVLPSKNVSARRIEDHPRNLNKKKNVNSSLYVKRFGYVSNKNAVCGACDKCLVSFNHDSCLVINVPSMNTMHAKQPQVARPKTTPKYIRKTNITIAPRIVPQWKPTGRQFLLCDIYGLKKSLTPIAKPLELSPSVSSSSPTTVISRFSDCQLSFQGQPVADSIADKIETTTTYGKFKRFSGQHVADSMLTKIENDNNIGIRMNCSVPVFRTDAPLVK